MGKFKTFFRSLPVRLIALILFALICIAAILYAKGIWDFTFVDRHAGAEGAGGDENNAPVVEYGPAPKTTDIHALGPLPEADPKDLVYDGATDVLDAGGKRDRTGLYDASTHTLAEVKLVTEFPNVYSYRQMYEPADEIREAPEGGYLSVETLALTDRKAVSLYAGYILYDCAGTMYLCDGTGAPLATFADGELAPGYCYNTKGEPLFRYKDRYCTYNAERHALVEANNTEYQHEVAHIGLYFDHAPKYGRGNGEIRYRNDKWMWSFINSANDELYKYFALYNYSESLAAAVEPWSRDITFEGEEGPVTVEAGYQIKGVVGTPTYVRHEQNRQLDFLNSAGETVLSGYNEYKDEKGRDVIATWQLPLYTHGDRAMGYLYFDQGLCRVREITMDAVSDERQILTDTDYLIRANGSRFPIPAGYTIVSYSNGRVLLEKDGKYGFYGSDGKWVVEPVYPFAEPYFEGLAVIGRDDGTRAVIDLNGDFVIPFSYSYISNCSSGMIAVYDETVGWKVLEKLVLPADAGTEPSETQPEDPET